MAAEEPTKRQDDLRRREPGDKRNKKPRRQDIIHMPVEHRKFLRVPNARFSYIIYYSTYII